MARGRIQLATVAMVAAVSVWASSGPAYAAKRKNYPLERARAAYDAFEYDRVLPLLDKALERALDSQEEVEIYAFMAEVHVVLDAQDAAADAFVQVLQRDPDYRLAKYTSPKVRAAFFAARERLQKEEGPSVSSAGDAQTTSTVGEGADAGANAGKGDALDAELTAIEPPNPDSLGTSVEPVAPWYGSWWFWTASGAGLAVLVVGTVSAILVLRQPSPPNVDYGIYPLP